MTKAVFNTIINEGNNAVHTDVEFADSNLIYKDEDFTEDFYYDECDQLCRRLLTQRIGEKYGLIFILMCATDLTVEELCNLKWCDIDFENRVLNVRPQTHNDAHESVTSTYDRSLHLSNKLHNILESVQIVYKNELKDSEYIIRDKPGNKYDPQELIYLWNQYVDDLFGKTLCFEDARKICADNLYINGFYTDIRKHDVNN